jgi:glycosyltransferase involved in cell wall biosynthesis
MKNNILIIDTKSKLNSFKDFFEELSNRDCELHFLLNKKNNFKASSKYHKYQLIAALDLKKTGHSLLFYLFLPVYLFTALTYLLYFKYSQKTNILVCIGCFEKLIFTIVGKVLKYKIIWLELPGEKNLRLKKLYVFLSHFTRLITFSKFHEQELLRLGIKSNVIKIIPIGIKLNNFQTQENIFKQLAETSNKDFTRKFFTIGTVVDLNEPQRIEILFQAIKKCLTVIHHLQLIVIGDGIERKNLTWLAKKMDIDNIVWFVGKQKNIRRWFNNFDIYVISSENFNLTNISSCLEGMAAELPIIGPNSIGVSDLIKNKQNGLLVEAGNSEPLAQAIIKLQQDKRQKKTTWTKRTQVC